MTYQPQPGDIGLSGVKAQGIVSVAIKLGSVLRHEKFAGEIAFFLFTALPLGLVIGAVWRALADGHGAMWTIAVGLLALVAGVALAVALIVLVAALFGFASKNNQWFSHSFIVHHVEPNGTVITESHATGVETRPLHYPAGEYVWLKTSVMLTDDDEDEMRALLDSVTAARWKYDYGTFAGLAIYAITGAMLAPAGVGTAICSGLTSEALTRGKAIWPLPAYRMMPQDQYWWAVKNGIEVVETSDRPPDPPDPPWPTPTPY